MKEKKCANYERDNKEPVKNDVREINTILLAEVLLSETEQNIKDYLATMPGRFKIHDKEYELTENNLEEIVNEIFNKPSRDMFMMNANTVIDSKAGLFLKKQSCQDPIVQSVRQKLLDRSNIGINKYNTTLDSNNTDNYLNHLQQEMMDGANYIEKLLQQKRDITQLVKEYPNDTDLGTIIRKVYG